MLRSVFDLRTLLFAFCTGFLLISVQGYAQEDELELMDSVAKCQQRLQSNDIAQRDRAEAELIAMGPEILSFLEPPKEDSTTDYRERFGKIRKRLEVLAADRVSTASSVTLSGKMTVGEALNIIKRQTRNQIVVSDPAIADIQVDLNVSKMEFWPAITKLMEKAELAIAPYGSTSPGQLGLTRGREGTEKSKTPADYDKIFKAQVTRVGSSVNLQNPELDQLTITLLIRWEPRLTPFSVDIPMSSVQIVDEYDESLTIPNLEETVYGLVQPEFPQLEFSLSLPRIDRQVESLKELTFSIDTLLPGKTEEFRFKKVAKQKSGFILEKAGAKVEYGGMQKNEDLHYVQMGISFDKENNALESHQGWVFQNEVFLVDHLGNREDSISLETVQQDNSKVVINYYFLEPPGERTLVYRTPASIVKLPAKMTLNGIPLP